MVDAMSRVAGHQSREANDEPAPTAERMDDWWESLEAAIGASIAPDVRARVYAEVAARRAGTSIRRADHEREKLTNEEVE
jgi:hypothetical protein